MFTVRGFEVRQDSVYEIVGKPDRTAPSGFKDEGVTKLPSKDISNMISCNFIETNSANGTGVYDTGLHIDSECYHNMNPKEAKSLVEALEKHIVKPYEAKHGKGVLSHLNTEFWNDYAASLRLNEVFSTRKVEDLLALFIALNQYDLCPKGKHGNPKYNKAQYCVEDRNKVQSIKSERAEAHIDAVTNFGVLLKTDKTKLANIFKYVGIEGVTSKTSNKDFKSIFKEWLTTSEANSNLFNKTFDMSEAEATKDVVHFYSVLHKLARAGKLERINSSYHYKGIELGADLKTAAKRVNTDKELEEVKLLLIEEL